MSDYYKLDTPFGPIWLHPCKRTEIYATTTPPGSRNAEPITVNRVLCTVGGHVTFTTEFGWRCNDLYIRRPLTGDHLSYVSEKKVRDTVAELVTTWAQSTRPT